MAAYFKIITIINNHPKMYGKTETFFIKFTREQLLDTNQVCLMPFFHKQLENTQIQVHTWHETRVAINFLRESI